MEPTAQIMRYLAERFTPKPVYAVQNTHNVETPSVADPCGICCTECPGVFATQSVNLRLTVSGGQPQLTFGLPMLTLSLKNFLYVLWGPSTNIDIFIHVKIIVFEGKKYWFSWKRFSFEDLLVAPLMPSWTWLKQASSWPLAGAMCYGGLEAHWSYLRYWF